MFNNKQLQRNHDYTLMGVYYGSFAQCIVSLSRLGIVDLNTIASVVYSKFLWRGTDQVQDNLCWKPLYTNSVVCGSFNIILYEASWPGKACTD